MVYLVAFRSTDAKGPPLRRNFVRAFPLDPRTPFDELLRAIDDAARRTSSDASAAVAWPITCWERAR